jgi:hypothetical protein
MDGESLIEGASNPAGIAIAPAQQLLTLATDENKWPENMCRAGEKCPFCTSRRLLSHDPFKSSLLSILRYYELATGKRWAFRDLFSLFSYLLSGASGQEGAPADPCEWAAKLADSADKQTGGTEAARLAAPFTLAGAQYQHALFLTWPREQARALRRDIKELKLDTHPAVMGFYYFLSRPKASLPATLQSDLTSLCAVLDPALADPELEVAVSAQTQIRYRDLDVRFSQSVAEGLRYIRKYRCLTQLELDVLGRLERADEAVANQDLAKRNSQTAARIQRSLRDFACRFVRRSLGAREGAVRDKHILEDFRAVVDGDPTLLHGAAKQVELLMNEKERFVVPLNTTFGEPMPPAQRRAILATGKQKIRPWIKADDDRPKPSLRFLAIGAPESAQYIPLTFDLFRSVQELKRGMMPASLPRAVVALLDTTRARLAGNIVRDEDSLDDAEIQIANSDEVIVRQMKTFIVSTKGSPYES